MNSAATMVEAEWGEIGKFLAQGAAVESGEMGEKQAFWAGPLRRPGKPVSGWTDARIIVSNNS